MVNKVSSKMVDYLQGGTGSTTRALEDKLQDVVSVKDFGAVGDGVTDDTAAVQAAIDASTNVFVPDGVYKVSGLTITSSGTSLVGTHGLSVNANTGAELVAISSSDTIIKVEAPESYIANLSITGLSDITERGEDVTNIGIHFDNASAEDIDSIIENVTIIYCQDCVRADGRNVRCNNVLFSVSKRGFYVPDGGTGLDWRGYEFYGCRWHSIGKDGAIDSAGVYLHPNSDLQEAVISGFLFDDCLRAFFGFASNMNISGGVMNKARGTGVEIDTTGVGVGADRRIALIGQFTYYQINSATQVASAVKCDAGCKPQISGVRSFGTGGHGIDSAGPFSQIHDCAVYDAGQAATNTYDCFYVNGVLSYLFNCIAQQDRNGSKTNKARYGFNLDADDIGIADLRGDDALFASGIFNRTSTFEVQGIEPRLPLRHEAWDTAAPVAGIWRRGDIVWNTSPSVDGNNMVLSHWICTVAGTPGTWVAQYLSTVSPAT